MLQNTKYCLKCGKQCNENAVMCVGCGWDFKANTNKIETSQKQTGSQTSIFLILASGLYGFFDLLVQGIGLLNSVSGLGYYSDWYDWYNIGRYIIHLPLDLLFIVFEIIGLKNRNNGKFTQNVLSLIFIDWIISNIWTIVYYLLKEFF